MSRRGILPFLCAAVLTLTAVPGFARVGVRRRFCPARSRRRGGARPTCSRLRLAAGLLELERRPVRLGARHICRAPLCSRGMGARKLGQAWRRLGVGRRPLAALAAVRSDERRFGGHMRPHH